MTLAEIEESLEQAVDDFSLADERKYARPALTNDIYAWPSLTGDLLEPGEPVIFEREPNDWGVGTLVGSRRTAVPIPHSQLRIPKIAYFYVTPDAQCAELAEYEAVVAPQLNADKDLDISDETMGILMDDISVQVRDGWSSPLLDAFYDLQKDHGALREELVGRVENMLVAIGRKSPTEGGTEYIVSTPIGFTPPVMHDFLLLFPLSQNNLLRFMTSVHKDIVRAYNHGYRVHGEWGNVVWDEKNKKMSVVVS